MSVQRFTASLAIANGIILAAAVTAALGLPTWLDRIVEYLAGFGFGPFIFQSLFMKSMMMNGSYWENVRKSFMPECRNDDPARHVFGCTDGHHLVHHGSMGLRRVA